jgi:hypothetical protein
MYYTEDVIKIVKKINILNKRLKTYESISDNYKKDIDELFELISNLLIDTVSRDYRLGCCEIE